MSESKITTNHKEITRWVEERGGRPARVQETDLIRIDYPGFTGEETLEPINWEQFFERFDENQLALLIRETTTNGKTSRFSKFVDRQTASEAKAARMR